MTGYVWGRYRGQSAKARVLMLKRVFGFAAATALAQAWAKKSPKWLSLAGALVLFQFLTRAPRVNRLQKNRPNERRRLETW